MSALGGNAPSAAQSPLRDRRIKALNTSRFEKYGHRYALDYCGHLADIMASWILVSYWRRPNSHCFGDRRDRGGNKARHRSRGVGSGPVTALTSELMPWNRGCPLWRLAAPTYSFRIHRSSSGTQPISTRYIHTPQSPERLQLTRTSSLGFASGPPHSGNPPPGLDWWG